MARTALVLGGGGITGIAWELGILKGLADRGIDLTGADRVIGTSAGSVVGAQIASGHSLDELYAEQLRPADREIGARMTRSMLVRLALPFVVPAHPQRKRSWIGSMALRAHPPGGDRRIEIIRNRIGVDTWPERDLQVTAVEAETGRFVTFTRDSGVDLVHAVAASCAVPLVWPAVTIDGEHYVDGGMRSTANADLAHGCDRVVVLAPLPQAFSRATTIHAQLDRVAPSARAVVAPDEQALAAIGKNVLNPSKRADAARAGLQQAAQVADKVRRAWVTSGERAVDA
jgi:NTE family protein